MIKRILVPIIQIAITVQLLILIFSLGGMLCGDVVDLVGYFLSPYDDKWWYYLFDTSFYMLPKSFGILIFLALIYFTWIFTRKFEIVFKM